MNDSSDLDKAQIKSLLKQAIAIIDKEKIEEKTQQSNEWKKLPPTEKQIKLLKENGYSTDNITRGQASEIIDKFFKEKKR